MAAAMGTHTPNSAGGRSGRTQASEASMIVVTRSSFRHDAQSDRGRHRAWRLIDQRIPFGTSPRFGAAVTSIL